MKIVCTAVVIYGFWIMIDGMQGDCIEIGCDRGTAFGESYCGYHKYSNEKKEEEAEEARIQRAEQARIDYYKERNSYNNSSSGNTSSGSSSSKSNYSSNASDNSYYESPYKSYDDGYDDMYFNGDYDYDRYYSDDEYAEGVDDAMYDLDEEGEPDC